MFFRIWRRLAAVFVAGMLGLGASVALALPDERFAIEIAEYPDLVFPSAMREWGSPSREGNDIFKPAGEGPFPAVVIAHTCGGVEPHLFEHAQTLVQAGFVVLVLDSYTVRRHFAFCRPAGVKTARFYKDTFDALAHLHRLPGVDPQRIYMLGFSLGSFAASNAGSPRVAELVGSAHRFTATVGWYGSCRFQPFRGPEWRLVREDTDRPVLLLMAGNDRETRIDDCAERLQALKDKGVPVQWHIYPGVSHGFDKDNPFRGYRRDAAAVADAMARTLAFFQQAR